MTSTGHLLSDWLGGKRVLLFAAMNQKKKQKNKRISFTWQEEKATALQMSGCKNAENLRHLYAGWN